ncbi:SDR family oxidoreductase [Novosphingobium aquimarinum]|uniref:SDR family oxidoreductase n=1 Tax=Novosphingobium aquimarinum TaxID=2682494 RepID=UPI0012EBDAA6|nr:SDR family oxidoreductase [Novosphingobium aquimarinum]
MKALEGRVAVVTGGSRGIGAAIVKRLAEEGATVLFTYVSSEAAALALAREAGGAVVPLKADSGNVEDVRRVIATAIDEHGRLDILVNSAGVVELVSIDEATLEAFDSIYGVNVRGTFVAMNAAAKVMGEGGRIINIGSISSDVMPFPGASIYGSSKAAVAAMARCAARDLGPRGITVNTVQVGPVDTDMNREDSEWAAGVLRTMAIPRYGRPEEVADMVAWLAGPTSAFVTGSTLRIDGGSAA